jgi:hypothetical protein
VPRKPWRCFTPVDYQSSFGAVAELIGHSISDDVKIQKSQLRFGRSLADNRIFALPSQ